MKTAPNRPKPTGRIDLAHPEGGQRVLQTLTFPIHWTAASIFGAVTRDISEFKQAHKNRRNTPRELEELNEEGASSCTSSPTTCAPPGELKGYSAEIRHALERLQICPTPSCLPWKKKPRRGAANPAHHQPA
jgi:hypothetical protein